MLEKARYPEKTLTVHLIAHSHLRLGWLKTIDEYYVGFKTDDVLQPSVKTIFNGVLNELKKDKNRKFTINKIKFFKMWYERIAN